MRPRRRMLVAGVLAAAMLATPAIPVATRQGVALVSTVPSAAAAQVNQTPKGKPMGQLLDEGYTCWPIGGGVVQCYRDKNSPKYECRVGGCYPVDLRRDPGGATQSTQTGSVMTRQE